ncbi:MAG: type II toxin-antitoxin system VapC family toxin [Armatimonadota bacterium]
MATGDAGPSSEEIAFPRRLYLDTQFCFAYLVEEDADHEAADDFALVLKQTSEAKLVECYVSILVVDELMWNLAGVLYDAREGPGSWRSSDRRRAFLSVRSEVATVVQEFLSEAWVLFLRTPQVVGPAVPRLLRTYQLASADLCHLAIARSAGLGIVTNDRDFHDLANPPVPIVGY